MPISDLLLLTSHDDGLPEVVLEAWSSSWPVVATDVGGTLRGASAGQTPAFSAPADEDEALAVACIGVLTDRGSAHRMAEAGTVFIHGEFGPAAMAGLSRARAR